jgi:hypothetical protein
MLDMYNVARLSDESQRRLRQQLLDEMASRRAAGQSLECALGLRHIKATRLSKI